MPALQGSFADTGLLADSNLFADTWQPPPIDPDTQRLFYDGYWISPALDKLFTVNSARYWYNLESLLGAPPLGERVNNGAVQRKALSGRIRRDGERVVTLTFSALYIEGLRAYCDLLWSDLQDGTWVGVTGLDSNIDAVLCTIALKQRTGRFRLYHAYAHLPIAGEDYEMPNSTQVDELSLRFTLLTT